MAGPMDNTETLAQPTATVPNPGLGGHFTFAEEDGVPTFILHFNPGQAHLPENPFLREVDLEDGGFTLKAKTLLGWTRFRLKIGAQSGN